MSPRFNTEFYRDLVQRTVLERDNASWRLQQIKDQAAFRRSIRELAFLLAGLALAYSLSDYFPGLAVVVAAAFGAGAMHAVWRESRAKARMRKEGAWNSKS